MKASKSPGVLNTSKTARKRDGGGQPKPPKVDKSKKSKPTTKDEPTGEQPNDAGGGVKANAGVKCPPTRVYVGSGVGASIEPLIIEQFDEAQRRADTEEKAINGARINAAKKANEKAKGKEPVCGKEPCCTPALSIKFYDPAQVEWETITEKEGIKILSKCQAKIKWSASWVCLPCEPHPTAPPDNPGHEEWEGGEKKEIPCPHPFKAGKTNYESRYICETNRTNYPKLKSDFEVEYDKFLAEAQNKATQEAFAALAALPDCPEGCPQAGPTSLVFGPVKSEERPIHCTTEGIKVERTTPVDGLQYFFTIYWTVERNCVKEEGNE